VNAFAIRREEGVLLVDTGVGEGNPRTDEVFQPQRQSLTEALQEHGISLGDVFAVVHGHLHFDHCGNDCLFPNIPIYVQRREWEVAREGYVSLLDWVDFDGADYRQLDGIAEIVPGVRVLPTPGHTVGHQAVVIDTPIGSVVLAGQVPYDVAEWRYVRQARALSADSDGASGDREAYLASVLALIDIEPRRVWFTHDDEPWDRD